MPMLEYTQAEKPSSYCYHHMGKMQNQLTLQWILCYGEGEGRGWGISKELLLLGISTLALIALESATIVLCLIHLLRLER